jgi:hypothetical protein
MIRFCLLPFPLVHRGQEFQFRFTQRHRLEFRDLRKALQVAGFESKFSEWRRNVGMS